MKRIVLNAYAWRCPRCRAREGKPCVTPKGRLAESTHLRRLHLLGDAMAAYLRGEWR